MNILVLANETIGGEKLLDAVLARKGEDVRFHVVVPDPYNAATDAIAEHGIDEIIVSTLPAATSGWLRRDLPERLREGTGLPVEHVVVDLAAEGLPFDVTLVAANVTATSPELTRRLKELSAEGPRRFIVVVPQEHVAGHAVGEARERQRKLVASLRAE